jgi:hypothetical protein
MPGSKPGERRGGRSKGTPNKSTVAKLIDAQVAEKVAEIVNAPPQEGATLQRYSPRARAKDELAEMLPVLKGHVGHFQQAAIASGLPTAPEPGKPAKSFNAALWKMYKDWFELYIKACDTAADFQDPRLKAQLYVSPPPDMPAQQAGGPPKVVRLGSPQAASRAYQQFMLAPRQKALPPPAKRSA